MPWLAVPPMQTRQPHCMPAAVWQDRACGPQAPSQASLLRLCRVHRCQVHRMLLINRTPLPQYHLHPDCLAHPACCARDADEAARRRDGVDFLGNRLRVEVAKGGDSRSNHRPVNVRTTGYRVVIKGLPRSASWQDLKVGQPCTALPPAPAMHLHAASWLRRRCIQC